ncbi:quaternary amine ABC transporter ATP-binding protein [Halomonas sp. 328]|uniref:quaternary amine ABC transporter ATP-binding protein n=1 Tax=Halomonas sp. 328 TaxID=2776704 RepID=UPI002DDBB8FF|nr:betaine/proline/choline family ABC transporter ATP-binding protein [Halomonas sp. 328]
MIRVEGVTKLFGPDPASALARLEAGQGKAELQAESGHVLGVNDVSFALEPGEVFVIMGLSGSGKSTLIRCINRLIEPTAGRIFLEDPETGCEEITGASPERLRYLRRRHLSMVFQHFALFPHRSVRSNVAYGLEIQGVAAAERLRRAQEVLAMVGLGDWGDAYPQTLSGGMQQRVGLARALATEARVLLMDEPFSALDPLIKVTMQQELKKLQARLGRTILFITHDLDEAMRLGDRIAIMEDGAIVQLGTPEQILVNPRTDYVARFVEHADPTAVITAGTIALPLADDAFSPQGERQGLRLLGHRDHPTLSLGLDEAGHLRGAWRRDHPLPLDELERALETPPPDRPRDDLLLSCSREEVLRRVLRGRLHSSLPLLVTGPQGQLQGLIDEPQLIHGILEKRGPRVEEATA